MKTWMCRLQALYVEREMWAKWAETFGLAERLGYGKQIYGAWGDNPIIGGSIEPNDFGVVHLSVFMDSYLRAAFSSITKVPFVVMAGRIYVENQSKLDALDFAKAMNELDALASVLRSHLAGYSSSFMEQLGARAWAIRSDLKGVLNDKTGLSRFEEEVFKMPKTEIVADEKMTRLYLKHRLKIA